MSRPIQVPTLREQAIAIARTLDSCQRCEIRALAEGRWSGDPLEVAGLRALGLQDDGLGVTALGRLVVDLLDLPWQEREPLGLCFLRD